MYTRPIRPASDKANEIIMSMDPFEFCEPVNKPRSRTPKNNKHRVAASRYPPVKMQHQQARANRPCNLALAPTPAPTPVGLPRAMDDNDDDDDTTQDDSDIIQTGRASAKRRLFVSNPDYHELPILRVSSEHQPIEYKLEQERIMAVRIPHNDAVIYFVSSDPRLQPAPGNDASLYSTTMAAFMRLQLNQESHSLFNSPPFGITDITCLVTVRCGVSHIFTPFILTTETTLEDLRAQTPFGDHDIRVYRNGEPADMASPAGMSKTLVDCGIRAGDDVLVVMDCKFTFF